MSVLAVALLTGVMLMFLLAQAYSFIGFSVIWTLPLWLMLHSLLYSSFWLGRIVALISRQSSDGLLDEVGVIPPGRVFIYISICKVVLHENDALAWLSIIRKFLAGAALLGLLMPVLVTMYQLDNIDLHKLLLMMLELALIALLIQLEHSQSMVMVCLLPMLLCRRIRGRADVSSVVIICLFTLQILSYLMAIALPLVLLYVVPAAGEAFGLALTFGSFIVVREMLILLLWRAVLHQENDERRTVFLPTRPVGRGRSQYLPQTNLCEMNYHLIADKKCETNLEMVLAKRQGVK